VKNFIDAYLKFNLFSV